MKSKSSIKSTLIAPCGMNCGICMAFLREKNHCDGYRGDDAQKPKYCIQCKIVNCENIKSGKLKYCSKKCANFPCERLKSLDKRYRTKYKMSMLENLENIEILGVRKFVRTEKSRWKCRNCGGTINVHRGICAKCGHEKLN